MTLRELSQLYWLKRELALDERRLRELEIDAGCPSSPRSSGDHVTGSGLPCSQVERAAGDIDELQRIIKGKNARCIAERLRIERWIANVPDSLTRQVFTYRFVDLCTWDQVAARIGGGNSSEGVKKICYRYLDAEKKKLFAKDAFHE